MEINSKLASQCYAIQYIDRNLTEGNKGNGVGGETKRPLPIAFKIRIKEEEDEKSLQIKTVVDVVADVRIIGVESAIGSVAEPVGIVVISGLVLAEDDFPESGVKVGIDGIEGWLSGSVGGREAFVMGVLIFVKDDLGDGPEEIGSFQSRKSNGVVPNDEAVAIR